MCRGLCMHASTTSATLVSWSCTNPYTSREQRANHPLPGSLTRLRNRLGHCSPRALCSLSVAGLCRMHTQSHTRLPAPSVRGCPCSTSCTAGNRSSYSQAIFSLLVNTTTPLPVPLTPLTVASAQSSYMVKRHSWVSTYSLGTDSTKQRAGRPQS